MISVTRPEYSGRISVRFDKLKTHVNTSAQVPTCVASQYEIISSWHPYSVAAKVTPISVFNDFCSGMSRNSRKRIEGVNPVTRARDWYLVPQLYPCVRIQIPLVTRGVLLLQNPETKILIFCRYFEVQPCIQSVSFFTELILFCSFVQTQKSHFNR